MQLEEIRTFIAQEFPQTDIHIETVGQRGCTVRQRVNPSHLRPGGTISGPTQMMVADVALYIAILNELGPVALAVTTSITLNFLNRPSADADLIGACKLLKVGKRLVIGEVFIYSDGKEEPVAHAVGTYSIPPSRGMEQPA